MRATYSSWIISLCLLSITGCRPSASQSPNSAQKAKETSSETDVAADDDAKLPAQHSGAELRTPLDLSAHISVRQLSGDNTSFSASVILQNDSNSPMELQVSDDGRQTKIILKDANGKEVKVKPTKAFGARQGYYSIRGFTLPPKKEKIVWNQPLNAYFALSPGEYTIKATFDAEVVLDKKVETYRIETDDVSFLVAND